ncbi:6-carboxy-5,6,7,8-tetrahydropterin synthase [bacterium BMS3Abin05]|nr:6-carboxy-5,6,7,8-tetrahydropterin synthase [bacterium BMS3Abin05]GBE28228.1 6-carboxy-5,6,7,8-tetrahydropterin synthase [bacterium BMS3Bbin03]HDL78819.1 6-carboxytetrahydropterin synthase [Bacteroidota bacterium]HDZ10620.1 6-carboxytetrahydropterin synthase [Bacteroidota bacterium]
MTYVTKRVSFSAAHRLYNPNFSDEKNEDIFGLCNNKMGHGHNYDLEVTVRGNVQKETGMVIDLNKLKKILIREIVEKVDHKHLNYDVPFLKGVIPTAENLAVKFWDILKDKIDEGELYEIKLYESRNNFVIYRAE